MFRSVLLHRAVLFCSSSSEENCAKFFQFRFLCLLWQCIVRSLNIRLPVTHSSDSSSHLTSFINLFYPADKLKPALTKITFGSLVGYCSGVATKKIGRALAIVAGVGFMLVQGAVYSGYIDVDWKKVQDDVASKVDANKDGALSAEDAKEYWKKVKSILTHNIPNAGGFSLGFLYGVAYA